MHDGTNKTPALVRLLLPYWFACSPIPYLYHVR